MCRHSRLRACHTRCRQRHAISKGYHQRFVTSLRAESSDDAWDALEAPRDTSEDRSNSVAEAPIVAADHHRLARQFLHASQAHKHVLLVRQRQRHRSLQ